MYNSYAELWVDILFLIKIFYVSSAFKGMEGYICHKVVLIFEKQLLLVTLILEN